MTMTVSTQTANHDPASYQHARAVRDEAAHDLYEAELALHDARQTEVDAWILAASNHLHLAVLHYTAAESALARLAG